MTDVFRTLLSFTRRQGQTSHPGFFSQVTWEESYPNPGARQLFISLALKVLDQANRRSSHQPISQHRYAHLN